jgi:WD40 repeat protein
LWDVGRGLAVGDSLALPDKGIISEHVFSADGKVVVVSHAVPRFHSWMNTARAWETATGKPLGPVIPVTVAASAPLVAVSADGRTILTTSLNEARVWDAVTGKPHGEPLTVPQDPFGRNLAYSRDYFQNAAFSPDAQVIMTINLGFGPAPGKAEDAFREVRLWEAATLRPLGPPLRGPNTAAFSPDGKTFLAAGEKEAWLRRVPTPLQGDPERIRLWVEVNTGQALDEGGAVLELDETSLRERWQRLQKLGGPPGK